MHVWRCVVYIVVIVVTRKAAKKPYTGGRTRNTTATATATATHTRRPPAGDRKNAVPFAATVTAACGGSTTTSSQNRSRACVHTCVHSHSTCKSILARNVWESWRNAHDALPPVYASYSMLCVSLRMRVSTNIYANASIYNIPDSI